MQDAPINNPLSHHRHQLGMGNAVKILRQVGVYDLGYPFTDLELVELSRSGFARVRGWIGERES